MKSSVLILLIASLLSFSLYAAEMNIAVFSPKNAILSSNTAKSRAKIMLNSTEFKQKKARFDALKAEGQALVEKVKADADVLSLSKKKEIKAQLESKEKELAEIAQEIKSKEYKINQELLKEMAPRLERAVKQVIKTNKIDLLLDRQLVMHANENLDVTEEIIKRLNQ